MAQYKCFNCKKTITSESLKRRVRCIYCGSKILFKQRTVTTKVIAR